MTNIYVIRQNPYEINSIDFINFIKINDIITCPYGHSNEYIRNIASENYNISANGQDRKFVDEVSTGDYIVIPIEGTKQIIIKKIVDNTLKFSTLKELYLLTSKDGTKCIVSYNNMKDEYYEGDKYLIELIKVAYKETITIGEFTIDNTIRFGQQTMSKIVKHKNYIQGLIE